MGKLGAYEENSIVVGDCLDVMAGMPDGCVDVVITDPDYGVGIDYSSTITGKKVRRKTFEEIQAELTPALLECRRVARRDLCVFWSGSWGRLWDFGHIAEAAELHIKHLGIWYKPNGAGPTGNGLGRRFEVWFWIEGNAKRESEWRFSPDVIKANRVTRRSKEGVLHPSQKPIELMERLIRFFSKEGDLIFDPFMGSGTTAVAADRLGRRWFGCDINPDYVNMALERLAKDRLERSQLEMPI